MTNEARGDNFLRIWYRQPKLLVEHIQAHCILERCHGTPSHKSKRADMSTLTLAAIYADVIPKEYVTEFGAMSGLAAAKRPTECPESPARPLATAQKAMFNGAKVKDQWRSAVPLKGFHNEKPSWALEKPPDALIISTRWG